MNPCSKNEYMKKIESLGPPRVQLAHTPTPLEPLRRLGQDLNVELFIKRDDLTGGALTGNKVRKLEYVMFEAQEKGADTVLTCGGAQSNHARATAVCAAKLGLRSLLLLRTPDPSNPPPLDGNSFLDRLVGADIVWVTPEEYQRRDEIFEREAGVLRKEGRKPYIIPEGASDPLGAWGYIRGVGELAADLAALDGGFDRPTTIIHATGSGGTAAGVILGAGLLGLNVRVASVNVCDDGDHFVQVIGEICEKVIDRFGLDMDFSRERDVKVIDGYVGLGYALSRPEELEFIRDVARSETIFLDPVYTGKAMYGLSKELARDSKQFGERIIFIHTGGVFGLFPQARDFDSLL